MNFPKPYDLGRAQVIHKDGETFKCPMLIVGANNYARQNLSFAITQKFDVHYFFFPNSETVWKVGVVLMPRTGNFAPHSFYTENKSIQDAFESLHSTIKAMEFDENPTEQKRLAWIMHSIYRCPKISLKDVLHLNDYSKEQEVA